MLLFDDLDVVQEELADVLTRVTGTCNDCRLSLNHPTNRGFMYRGNPLAEIAVVHEAPRDSETERGVPLVGAHGAEFERWMRMWGLDSRIDVFITPIVQCQPPRVTKSGKTAQREPDITEVSTCFGPRCLRVLRALPQLRVVLTLGWSTAKAFLGTGSETPKAKTHESQWFETSLLPGIPVYCMVDPAWVIRDPLPEKFLAAERSVKTFQREYLSNPLPIQALAKAARQAREAKGLGLL